MATELFLLALAFIESGNRDVPGDRGAAQGYHQLHKITVREANRINGLNGLSLRFKVSDRHNYKLSARITKTVLEYHGKRWERKGYKMTIADLTALHRFGPTRWTPTRTYSTDLDRRRAKDIKKFMTKLK